MKESSKELTTTKEVAKELTLESIISNVIKAPGVKVDRKKFLADILDKETDDIQSVIELGPVGAGIDEKTLRKIATKLILTRTSYSSIAFKQHLSSKIAM